MIFASMEPGIFEISTNIRDESAPRLRVALKDATDGDIDVAGDALFEFLAKHATDGTFMVSSSVDFPDEYDVSVAKMERLWARAGLESRWSTAE